MCNPVRKLLTKTRHEPSGPVLEPRSRLTRKSTLRGLASCTINMGGTSQSASDSNIVSNQKNASNQDIACSATLGNPAILHDSTMLSNTVTLSDPAIVRDSARLSNPETPSDPARFSNPSMLSNADEVRVPSPSQSLDIHNNNSTPTTSNPLEGKTTAVIAVMRGNPKDGYTCLRSNKHCKQKMVRVLLDSGSDGDLIFVNKDKLMLLPNLKRLVPQLGNTLNGIFQMGCKARLELNFFEYSDSKRFHLETNVVKYDKDVSSSMTSFLALRP
jgi:hypothetical protein